QCCEVQCGCLDSAADPHIHSNLRRSPMSPPIAATDPRTKGAAVSNPDFERPSLVDVAGAAAYLGTSIRFLRRLIAARRSAFHPVGRLVRLDVSDLRQYLDVNRVEPIRPGLA